MEAGKREASAACAGDMIRSRWGLEFVWDLWHGCNYRCSYCWFDGQWEALAKKHLIIPPEDWIACWDRIFERYGSARLHVLGGEPLSYPGSLELFAGLARRHRLEIHSNLSAPLDYFRRLARTVQPGRVNLTGSFHPQFASLEHFIAAIDLLRDGGYRPSVCMVAYPPFLEVVREKRKFFMEQGLAVQVVPFTGRWEGRGYPEAYTSAERAALGGILATPGGGRQFELNDDRTFGKLCATGYIRAGVKSNGDVYRCSRDYEHILGNIFDPGVKLFDAPRPCPAERCNNSCGERGFLWENWSMSLMETILPVRGGA